MTFYLDSWYDSLIVVNAVGDSDQYTGVAVIVEHYILTLTARCVAGDQQQ